MEFLAIIPARGGSKGIPRKNIKPLKGHPLIYYTINAALNSKYIDRVVVSTEDKEIASVAKSCGAEIVWRPKNLAKDETKSAPVVMDTIKQLLQKGYAPDVIILLQATCPLRDVEELDETIEFFIKNYKSCDSVFTAVKEGITHGLWKSGVGQLPEALYDFRNRPRRQDTDLHYDLLRETGETYIIKTRTFLKLKDFIGERPKIKVVDEFIDIDTIEDFKRAEELL